MKIKKRNSEDFVVLSMDKEKDILIVDPYIISTEDIKLAGIKNVIRVRRPGWGNQVIHGSIGVAEIESEDLEKLKDLFEGR